MSWPSPYSAGANGLIIWNLSLARIVRTRAPSVRVRWTVNSVRAARRWRVIVAAEASAWEITALARELRREVFEAACCAWAEVAAHKPAAARRTMEIFMGSGSAAHSSLARPGKVVTEDFVRRPQIDCTRAEKRCEAFAVRRFPAKVEGDPMKLTVELQVLNELGLHARPATEFVRCALRFKSTTVRLHKGEQCFTATSILEVLSAELDHGTVFLLEAEGPEAEAAVEAFTALMFQIRDDEAGSTSR